MNSIVTENLDELKRLCLVFNVKSMYVFGSVCTDAFTEKSDIDLIVDIDSHDPIAYADDYFSLKFAIQDLLKRPIDLLENKEINNPVIRKNIDNSKLLLYAKG
jgi:predicted nucleotidyltransferase